MSAESAREGLQAAIRVADRRMLDLIESASPTSRRGRLEAFATGTASFIVGWFVVLGSIAFVVAALLLERGHADDGIWQVLVIVAVCVGLLGLPLMVVRAEMVRRNSTRLANDVSEIANDLRHAAEEYERSSPS